jgi:hypothetical protein
MVPALLPWSAAVYSPVRCLLLYRGALFRGDEKIGQTGDVFGIIERAIRIGINEPTRDFFP